MSPAATATRGNQRQVSRLTGGESIAGLEDPRALMVRHERAAIHADQSELGLELAPAFQRLAAVDYALAN